MRLKWLSLWALEFLLAACVPAGSERRVLNIDPTDAGAGVGPGDASSFRDGEIVTPDPDASTTSPDAGSIRRPDVGSMPDR